MSSIQMVYVHVVVAAVVVFDSVVVYSRSRSVDRLLDQVSLWEMLFP